MRETIKRMLDGYDMGSLFEAAAHWWDAAFHVAGNDERVLAAQMPTIFAECAKAAGSRTAGDEMAVWTGIAALARKHDEDPEDFERAARAFERSMSISQIHPVHCLKCLDDALRFYGVELEPVL